MSTRAEKYRQWATGLRLISYLCGFAGVAIMLSDSGRSSWSILAYVLFGITVTGFVFIYALTAISYMRK